jgi:hypothetical protein
MVCCTYFNIQKQAGLFNVSFGNLVDLAKFPKIGQFYFQSSGHSATDAPDEIS